MSRVWLLLVLCVGGCLEARDVDCGGGVICPEGRVCAKLTAPDENVCVKQAQLDACSGKAEADECSVDGAPPSSCQDGACVPVVCGNKRVDRGEICDDGDTVTGDGICSGDCKSDETCGNGAVDPLVLVAEVGQPNEQCDDGNLMSGDGCSSTCNNELRSWANVSLPITPLMGSRMAYDPARKRMVLFGGKDIDTATLDDVVSEATFEWTGTSWVRIPTTIAPTARVGHAMAYDGITHRVILFGGHSGDDKAPFSDTWAWDGNAWKRLVPATTPPGRSDFGMVYAASGKQVVMFGGYDGTGHRDDTWAWNGTDWKDISSTDPSQRPPGRGGQAMAYDPKRGVVVMAGGVDEAATTRARSDTWELSGTTWTLTNSTTPGQLDISAGMAYDTANSRMIAFGGIQDASIESSTTLAYDSSLKTWSPFTSSTPSARSDMAMGSDPNTGAVLMFGGKLQGGQIDDETWSFNGSWSKPVPVVPAARSSAGVAFDPNRGVLWTFGGSDDTGTQTATLQSFDGRVWATWTTAGPPARDVTGVAYDVAHDRLVVFGGNGIGDVSVPADTWLWNGTSWSKATPATQPSARSGPAMTYDAKRKVVVLFGGYDDSTQTFLDDTWEWNGTTWAAISTATKPPKRALGGLTFDVERGIVLLSGGFDLNPSATLPVGVNDLWSFDGVTWTKVVDPAPMSSRFFTPLAYDPAARESVVFGGRTAGNGLLYDTWAWDGAGWIETYGATHPDARGGHALTRSIDGSGVLLIGGQVGYPTTLTNDVWRLRYENQQPREICAYPTDNDGDGRSGCADEDCWAQCTPQCPPGAPCDPAAPHCGDGVCNTALENCRLCAADCMCTAVCGDTFCDTGETLASCAGDCTP